LRRRYEEFRQAGAEVVIVSFVQDQRLQFYSQGLDLPFPLLSDPDRRAYTTYGLRRGGIWTIFGPKIIWTYIKLILHGRRFRGIQGDPMQLGGDFVIDGQGVIRFAYLGADPADRPPVERLLQAVREPAA
jgi:peroxiredoxin